MVSIDSLESLRTELAALGESGFVQADGPLERRGIEVDHVFYTESESSRQKTAAAANQTLLGDREALRHAFQRAAILSNEKYRGVRLLIDGEQLTIQANNPEQEEAEEVVPVAYDGENMEIGFNVSYLQDVLTVLDGDEVRLSVSDANSSALIEGPENEDAVYVVMPMRL